MSSKLRTLKAQAQNKISLLDVMTNCSTMTRTGSVMRVPQIGKNTPRKSHFKCAIVGDSQCGKTSLVRSHTTKLTFPYTVECTRPLPSQYPGKDLLQSC